MRQKKLQLTFARNQAILIKFDLYQDDDGRERLSTYQALKKNSYKAVFLCPGTTVYEAIFTLNIRLCLHTLQGSYQIPKS
jgi:hypothetical protein